jgi:hypothetical protein
MTNLNKLKSNLDTLKSKDPSAFPIYIGSIIYIIIIIPIIYISISYWLRRYKAIQTKTVDGKIISTQCEEYYDQGIKIFSCNIVVEYSLNNINKTKQLNVDRYEDYKVNDNIKLYYWDNPDKLYITYNKRYNNEIPTGIELLFLGFFIFTAITFLIPSILGTISMTLQILGLRKI